MEQNLSAHLRRINLCVKISGL